MKIRLSPRLAFVLPSCRARSGIQVTQNSTSHGPYLSPVLTPLTTPEELTEIIRNHSPSYPAILAVYLFGSHSTGKAKPDSDLDLAILLQPGLEDDFPILELTVSLEKALGRRVDLVILNRAGELLKYQVRRNGCLLYERDPRLRKQFEVRGRKSFEDFLYLHRLYLSRTFHRPA